MKRWQQRGLGILCVGGGGLGFALAANSFSSDNSISWLISLAAMFLYGWGIWCGVGVFEGRNNVLWPCRIFWALQIPFLQLPHFTYLFTCGMQGIVTVSNIEDLKFQLLASFGSQFQFSIFRPEQPLILGINVFALCVTLALPTQFSALPA